MSSGNQSSFITDWQIEKSSNAERAKHLLESGLHHDCEFLVGNDEKKQVIKAHRIILSMGSPVFETMFYGGLPVKEFPVEVCDIQPEAFESLLEYIYTENMSFSTFQHACDVSYAAKKYMIPSLVQKCADFMFKDLGPNNIYKAMEFAHFYDNINLMEECLKLVRNKTRVVISNVSFEEAEESTVVRILSLDELNVTELELFQALLRWGKKECCRRDVPEIELRQIIAGPLSHIRFLAMTSEQFASGPARSGVLTVQESHDIFMNLSSYGICPLPPSVSTNNQPRILPSTSSATAHNSDPSKIFCYRRVERENVIYNEGLLDSSVSFTMDRNICIHGLILAAQVSRPCDTVEPSTYTELLYCHLLDKDGTRLTYAHFSGRTVRNSTVHIYFNRPVYIQRNREYRLCVVLNREGYYPVGDAAKFVLIQGIYFRFNTACFNQPGEFDDIRDGLIRGVILTL